MPNENIFLDGNGKFQQSTENAGAIKYGEFTQVSKNTGFIAVSALFTGSAVNSGTIGNYLPHNATVLVQTNSANWDAAFNTMGDYVLLSDERLSDAREPLVHTQSISTIDGLDDVIASLLAGAGAPVIATTDITDFDASVNTLIAANSPVQSVAGKTGAVTLTSSDISGLSAAIVAYAPAQLVSSVAGKTGVVTIDAADVLDFNTAADARITAAMGNSVAALINGMVPAAQLPSYVDDVLEYSTSATFPGTGETGKIYVATTSGKIYRWSGSTYVEIAASPGSTDSVTEGSSNLYFTTARAVAAAPVSSVAGRTGAVTLTVLDVVSAAPLSALPSVTSTTSWNSVYSTVNANSATWNNDYTLLSANSSLWSTGYTAYTYLTATSAAGSITSTNFGAISATSMSLSSAMLSTYSTPVTASGDFIVVTIGNKQRLIRIWDFK